MRGQCEILLYVRPGYEIRSLADHEPVRSGWPGKGRQRAHHGNERALARACVCGGEDEIVRTKPVLWIRIPLYARLPRLGPAVAAGSDLLVFNVSVRGRWSGRTTFDCGVRVSRQSYRFSMSFYGKTFNCRRFIPPAISAWADWLYAFENCPGRSTLSDYVYVRTLLLLCRRPCRCTARSEIRDDWRINARVFASRHRCISPKNW